MRPVPASIALVLLLLGGMRAAASPQVEDVPLPGGIKALARVLDVSTPPDPPRAVSEFARLLHGVASGVNAQRDERLARLVAHATAVSEFQAALARVQGDGGGVTLSMATAGKTERKRLQDFLDLVGLRLRERSKQFTVERHDGKDAAARVRMVADAGVDLASLATRLNAGDTVRIEVPVDLVPLPFTPRFWADTVLHQKIDPPNIVLAILSDRNAALLCYGLLSLDDETLGYLAAHPQVVEDLVESRAGAFAVFGSALKIRNGHVLPPGGAAAAPLWEDVVGVTVARPEPFIHDLFGREDGRVAYVYSLLAQLDPDRRAFALGTWMPDGALRRQRFRALVQASTRSVADWDIGKRPFSPAPYDAAMLLAAVRVHPGGGPVEPSALKFWSRVFDSTDLPNDPTRQLRNMEEDGAIDAAWLVEQVAAAEPLVRPVRFEQLRFGQRLFAGAGSSTLGDVLVAVRATPRFPMLMAVMEHAGAVAPSTFAAAARRAAQLSDLDSTRAYRSIAQFQGGLTLVDRLIQSGRVERTQADPLLAGLSSLEPDADGHMAGAIAGWLQASIGSALSASAPLTESALIDAAAGLGGAEGPLVRWEERSYRVDLAGASARHLHRAREQQKGPSLDAALALDGVRRRLAARDARLADVRSASETLAALAPQLAPIALTAQERPHGIDDPPDLRDLVSRAVRDLARITRPQDLKKAADVSRRLGTAADVAMTDALLTLSYVWALGIADAQGTDGGVVALRHDFGFGEGEAGKRTMWAEPKPDLAPGTPWHVRGALLGLDLAFATQALQRLSADAVHVPVLGGNDALAIARGVVLLNPPDMRDEDQAAIAAAIARGRRRVAALQPDSPDLDAVAEAAGLDGWRVRSIRWSLAHDPALVSSYLSTEDLLTAGGIEANVRLSAWGTADGLSGTCLCPVLDGRSRPWTVIGRGQLGLVPAEVPDLHLRVAVVLQELGLPAALARSVLAAVAQSYIDRVTPTDGDDWLTLVRQAQQFPKEDIEDAVASLTAGGPLVPASAAAAQGAR